MKSDHRSKFSNLSKNKAEAKILKRIYSYVTRFNVSVKCFEFESVDETLFIRNAFKN